MNRIKVILALMVVFCLTFSIIISASAADMKTNDDYVNSYASALRSFLGSSTNNSKSQSVSQSVPTDKMVEAFIAKHGSEYDFKKLHDSNVVKKIKIDKDNEITLEKGFVYVKGCDTVAATKDRIKKGAINISDSVSTKSVLLTSSGTTPILSYYYAAYGTVAGNELWRIVQEAQFTYTGSSVNVNYSNGYYKRGTLSVWQVSNWKDSIASSIKVNNIWTKRVMSSGNFHWGAEYDGNGIVLQDKYVWIDVRCTVNGATSSYYSVS